MQSSLPDRIRERAYELWLATGRVEGQAEQHWIAAERQLLSEMTANIPTAEAAREKQAQRPKSSGMKAGALKKRAKLG